MVQIMHIEAKIQQGATNVLVNDDVLRWIVRLMDLDPKMQ